MTISISLIGVGRGGYSPPPPPSEPDRRISRIRLSSRWFYPIGGRRNARWAACKENNPWASKKAFGQLVNQAEPHSSFHPRVEGRQHARRPDRGFDPGPSGRSLSRLRSPCGHWHGGRSRRSVHPTSTFLHPFAPRALSRFLATMGALTPGRLSSPPRSPCVTGTAFLTIPPPITLRDAAVPFTRYPSERRPVPRHAGARGPRLRTWLAGSPSRQAESSSSSCGLVVHLLRLSTSSHDDAVAVGYGLESVLPGEDFHLSDLACLQAH